MSWPRRPLAQRLFADVGLELADQPGVAAELQVRIEPVLERGEAKLFQACDVRLEGALEGQVGERRATPKGQSFVQGLRGLLGAAGLGRQLRLADGLFEAVEVQLAGLHPQRVAWRAGHANPAGAAAGAPRLEHVR